MSNLDNLGDYGAFTTAAKDAGGVANYIKDIERGVAPKYTVMGFAFGITATVVVSLVKREVAKRRLRAERAKEAIREDYHP